MNNLNHIAFIMDGNGRWGLKNKKSRNHGHLEGVKTVQKIVKASILFQIPIVSFYVFSSENWKRPKNEINYLFNLIKIYFKKEINNIIENKIRINILGRTNSLPNVIKKTLITAVKKTKKNKKLIVNLAINYGSKNEIIDSFKKIKSKSKKINQENIDNNLYSILPHPDILIRTGGQKRLSNFMLWQLAYTEIFFLNKLWPEFSKNDLNKIIKKFHSIKRNFGGI
jgi:undecaprenyl diphosphate synthase|tara:strand:+ start:2203 stop:2877 length:675 start_codon:yes stop_codon:yes gene_type:complete